MTESVFIHFGHDEGKVKSFSTASGAKATKLTIVLEMTDSYALSRILEVLHSAQHPPKPVPPPPAHPKAQRLALPAPALGLPFYGDDA